MPEIAIIGMAGRFPGAQNICEFWENICANKVSITKLARDEIIANGESKTIIDSPEYVKSAAMLQDYDKFDADFFKIPPRLAQLIDPQQRLLLEVAWEAFEDAGYIPEDYPGEIGAFTGSGGVLTSYLIDRLLKNPELLDYTGSLLHLGNDKDFVSARLSYSFNLKGPSINVQTACSTSITALHLACQSIMLGESDLALVGTSNVRIPHYKGYLHVKNSIYSPDGYCYPFDARAKGTIFGSGVASIILKDAKKAHEDNDNIYAVICATAVNNDGSQKLSFTTTNTQSQAKVMTEAFMIAGIDPSEVTYVECHGTGTYLGDPLEVQALNQAFSLSEKTRAQDCAISSVKGNIGHIDHSAGLAGVIKVALALKEQKLPGTANYEIPNPEINFSATPFFVNKETKQWQVTAGRRIACVNSLGLGGTNSFAILAERKHKNEQQSEKMVAEPSLIFTVSAQKKNIITSMINRYLNFFEKGTGASIADICFTNCVGRKHFKFRKAVIVNSIPNLKSELLQVKDIENENIVTLNSFILNGNLNSIIELSYLLYTKQANFRKIIDTHCAATDLSFIVDIFDNKKNLQQLDSIQRNLLCFILEYSVCQQWLYWGIAPKKIIGLNYVSNLVAACISGVCNYNSIIEFISQKIKCLPTEISNIKDVTITWLPIVPISDYKNLRADISFYLEQSQYNHLLDEPEYLLINSGVAATIDDLNRDSSPSWLTLINTIKNYYLNGYNINWYNFYKGYAVKRVSLPTYAFEKNRYWLE